MMESVRQDAFDREKWSLRYGRSETPGATKIEKPSEFMLWRFFSFTWTQAGIVWSRARCQLDHLVGAIEVLSFWRFASR
jgi:hypothetical protein